MKLSPNNTAFSNPASGAALQIRVNVGEKTNRLKKIDSEGLLHIGLVNLHDQVKDTNWVLCHFLAEVCGVPVGQVEVAAGHDNADKLVCIINVPVDVVNQRIANYTTA